MVGVGGKLANCCYKLTYYEWEKLGPVPIIYESPMHRTKMYLNMYRGDFGNYPAYFDYGS